MQKDRSIKKETNQKVAVEKKLSHVLQMNENELQGVTNNWMGKSKKKPKCFDRKNINSFIKSLEKDNLLSLKKETENTSKKTENFGEMVDGNLIYYIMTIS